MQLTSRRQSLISIIMVLGIAAVAICVVVTFPLSVRKPTVALAMTKGALATLYCAAHPLPDRPWPSCEEPPEVARPVVGGSRVPASPHICRQTPAPSWCRRYSCRVCMRHCGLPPGNPSLPRTPAGRPYDATTCTHSCKEACTHTGGS